MALKDSWIDKVNEEDVIDAEDINDIAHAVIELENKPEPMPNALGMEDISSLDNTDSIIVHDVPANVTKRMRWTKFVDAIMKRINKKVTALNVADENGSGFVASIPDLEDNTVILTEQDIPRIVAAVIAELNK